MSTHHLVARLMAMAPEELGRPAFGWPGGSLSLARLREGMLRFARRLSGEAGVRAGDRVALCMPKSPESLQALYGIMAAGAVHVPLQVDGPQPRFESILSAVAPRLLVTTPAVLSRLGTRAPSASLAIEPLPDGGGLELAMREVRPLADVAPVGADDLAWIVFTSGSTGEPKGVMLSHRNLATVVEAMRTRDRLGAEDVRLSHAPLHYMGSFDLLLPAVCGLRLYLLGEREAKFPEHVAEVIARERATVWSSSATALRLLLEEGALKRHDLGAMRRVTFFGEPMPPAVLRRLMALMPAATFVNHYASTEAGAIAHYEVPRPLAEGIETLPLGRPAEHCALTIRDDDGRELAAGEVGEICIAGPGVMLGYWGDPEGSAARRLDGVPCSFRTGDLGVVGPDGLLRSMGRTDQMVKVRGHRLDLGEVEAVLRTHPVVREAAVFAREDGARGLEIAALVQTDGAADCRPALRSLCRKRLPGHAQPAEIRILGEFPLLPSGKIDRRALRAIIAASAG